ncbi:hypothetical protein CDIK_1240 [Cucumispora dikerogammari]|nr:hypothetical protein CDIK_1240 [Cucumispora dikerogammari]
MSVDQSIFVNKEQGKEIGLLIVYIGTRSHISLKTRGEVNKHIKILLDALGIRSTEDISSAFSFFIEIVYKTTDLKKQQSLQQILNSSRFVCQTLGRWSRYNTSNKNTV